MRIYVEIDNLEKSSSKCKRLINELSSIQNSFASTARSLDWDIKSKANIQRYIDNLGKELSKARETAGLHTDFLNDTREDYINAEKYNQAETIKLKNQLYKKAIVSPEISGNSVAGWLNSKSESELLSLAGKFAGVFDNLTGKGLSLLSYFNKMYEHYKTGKYSMKAGFDSVFTYAKDALGLWDGMYSFVENYYKHKDISLGINPKSGNSLTKAFGKTTAGKISQYIPVLSTILTTGNTIYESCKKYLADGSIDAHDVTSILIEGSVAGIYSVGGGLLGFIPGAGLPLSIGYDVLIEKTNLVENTSSAIINWADDTGKKWGYFMKEYSTIDSKSVFAKSHIANTFSATWNLAKETKQKIDNLSSVYKMIKCNC